MVEKCCYSCPHSKVCPEPVKLNYGFTLAGSDRSVCQAYNAIENAENKGDTIRDLTERSERTLKILRNAFS